MTERRLVRIQVKIVDAVTDEVLGEASRPYRLPTDLLTSGYFPYDQDAYSAAVGSIGTEAYTAAFPREVRS